MQAEDVERIRRLLKVIHQLSDTVEELMEENLELHEVKETASQMLEFYDVSRDPGSLDHYLKDLGEKLHR